jgi:hypothetical protein
VCIAKRPCKALALQRASLAPDWRAAAEM